MADWAAKEAAKGTFIMPLLPALDLSQFDPEYSTADLEKVKSWGFDEEGLDSGWKKNKNGLTLLPDHLVVPVMKHLHEATHYGRDPLTNYLNSQVLEFLKPYGKHKLDVLCARRKTPKQIPIKERRETIPRAFEDWQIDFTQMPRF